MNINETSLNGVNSQSIQKFLKEKNISQEGLESIFDKINSVYSQDSSSTDDTDISEILDKFSKDNISRNEKPFRTLPSEIDTPLPLHFKEAKEASGIIEEKSAEEEQEEYLDEKYGKKYEDMTEEEQEEYDNWEKEDALRYMITQVKTEEKGVCANNRGEYTITSVELYNGYTYEQLSDEDKAKIDEWEKNANIETLFGKDPAECPLEYTRETRIKKNEN